MNQEQKTAGATFILNFFKEVNNLTNTYAQYINISLEIETKYGKDNTEDISEIDKNSLSQTLQTVRYYSLKTYIMYKSLLPTITKQDNKEQIQTEDQEIEKNYKAIANKYIIPKQDLEEFVKYMNKILIKDIIQELLNTSNDIVDGVFKN